MDAILGKMFGTGLLGGVLGCLSAYICLMNKIKEKDKIIAQTKKTIAEYENQIVEKDRIIAETKKVQSETELQALEKISVNIGIQEILTSENNKYKECNTKLANSLEKMAKLMTESADLSSIRNESIKNLTESIDSFAGYLDKARYSYKKELRKTIEDIILNEVGEFLSMLSNYTEVLNSVDILKRCDSSKVEIFIGSSSLHSVKIFLREVTNDLGRSEQYRFMELLLDIVKSNGFIDKSFLQFSSDL